MGACLHGRLPHPHHYEPKIKPKKIQCLSQIVTLCPCFALAALPLEHCCCTQCDVAHVCRVLLQDTWSHVEFKFTQHKGTDVYLVKMAEEDFEALEDNQVLVQVRQHNNAQQQMQASAAMFDWLLCCLWSVCCVFVDVCATVIATQHGINVFTASCRSLCVEICNAAVHWAP